MTVANTIMAQLGGRRFTVMTGAKNYVGGDNILSFHLPLTRHNGKKINAFRITLDPSDSYTLEALYINRKELDCSAVDKRSNVYCDNLQEHFTDMTGLYTRL